MESNNHFSTEDVSFVIKQLTKTTEFNKIAYFEISKAGLGIDMLDIVNELRRNKISFLTSIIQRTSIEYGHRLQSFIVSIVNQREVSDLLHILYRSNGILRIKDSTCRVKLISGDLKCAFAYPSADLPVLNADKLPSSIKFTLNARYHKFLPSVLLVEILQEFKVKEIIANINGLSLKYLSTPRLIDNTVILRMASDEHESLIENVLSYLGNTDIETLLETQILAHLDIWAQISRTHTTGNLLCYVLSHNLLSNDLFTNGREINALLNRLGPYQD
jgi:hypothetical protein